MTPLRSPSVLVCAALTFAPHFTHAEDAYYTVPLASLKASDGTSLVAVRGTRSRNDLATPLLSWHAALNGEGEVFLSNAGLDEWNPRNRTSSDAFVAIRSPKGIPITGRVFASRPDGNGMAAYEFKLSPTNATMQAKEAFFEAKETHYRRLLDANIPGAAWFRHQAQEAAKSRGAATNAPPENQFPGRNRWRESELEDTYDLFTGGRALSENLQLDRVLLATKAAEATVDITNLSGITVQEMNWKKLLQDARPELDPLAALIPADQHAVFFPSFQAMIRMIDEADANGTPVLQLLDPRSEDTDARGRYQKQLCLGLSEISRLLGPQVVTSVAFTGSDPYVRVGTDVAILFETSNPALLKAFLLAQQKAAQSIDPALKAVNGEIGGVNYTGVISPDRSVCSYLASITNAVCVCNSLKQLKNLIRVAQGDGAALNSQDEYRFFRQRYPRSDTEETAFVVLTDATIRRWCGPEWRIADSRRTRAAAVLCEMEAAHLQELVKGEVADIVPSPEYNPSDLGELRFTRAGISSSTYGTLHFMAPIAELALTRVTQAEADAYKRWRDGYQRNWRQFFDPIAIRFEVARARLGLEITVMPLIAATDYRGFLEISAGAQIAPGAGDPHTNTLLHLVCAINTKSEPVQQAGNFVGSVSPVLKANPFGWLGPSIALYADDDPFWNRLGQATNAEEFLERNYVHLPLALQFEVKNPLGLAGFLTALRAYTDQTAPQLTAWQSLEYEGCPYVKVTSKGITDDPGMKDLAVYYAATPRSLVVTLSETVLKQALDRQLARANTTAGENPSGAVSPWLGTNLCVLAERKFFDVLQLLTQSQYRTRMQVLAWSNLPVLNEWKRLFPDKDPVKLHEEFWGAKLVCPGGGTYRWNEQWRTMESTVFGHPGDPKSASTKALADIISVQLGVSFENQGLSARGVLNRNARN